MDTNEQNTPKPELSDSAAQCGFQTTKYFITVFKRLKGKTPKSWRETQEKV